MGWLEDIQNKPTSVKMRIIWTVVIVVAILLILVWGLSYKFQKDMGRDTTLFDTISQGFHDIKANFHK